MEVEAAVINVIIYPSNTCNNIVLVYCYFFFILTFEEIRQLFGMKLPLIVNKLSK